MSNLCPSCDEYAMPREWELDKEEIELLRQQAAADKAEIEALRKEAERYWFLRDAFEPPNGVSKADVIYLQHLHGEKLDAAIDAAIADK